MIMGGTQRLQLIKVERSIIAAADVYMEAGVWRHLVDGVTGMGKQSAASIYGQRRKQRSKLSRQRVS